MSTYDLFYVNIWLILCQDLTYLTSTCVFVNMWLHSLMATCFLTYANTSTWVLCQLVTCLVNIWHVIYRHVTCFISNMWLVLFQTWLALCQHVTCLMSFCDLSDLNMWLFMFVSDSRKKTSIVSTSSISTAIQIFYVENLLPNNKNRNDSRDLY